MALCFPAEAVSGRSIDFDPIADYLELAAFFASDDAVPTSDVGNATGLAAAEDHRNLQDEMQLGEEGVVSGVVARIEQRQVALDAAYPYELDLGGDLLSCRLEEGSLSQTAYVLSLVLSNLRALSPVLDRSGLHPEDDEVPRLRQYFQGFATAALAAEVQGAAWSFGFPRPDGSGFLEKLEEIWRKLRDGRVQRQPGAPERPKDDRIDVFAARLPSDGLPGFLLAAAQVATGRDAREKSLKGHLGAFRSRWFSTQPATEFVPYMIVPFATADDRFRDDVRVMGNVLHRLRVPRLVAEAGQLEHDGVTVEGYNRLSEVAGWVTDYRTRAGAA